MKNGQRPVPAPFLRGGRLTAWHPLPGLLLAAGSALLGMAGPARSAGTVPGGPEEFFEKNVRPVLVENCCGCHSGALKKPMGGLRLDSRAAALKGGARGPAIVPGAPESSLLIRAISYRDPRLQMPPRGRLPEEKIAALTRWVKMGAPWPGSPGMKAEDGRRKEKEEERNHLHPSSFRPQPSRHWAFQPLKRPPLPAVKRKEWPQSPIDYFILAKLEAAGLSPAPPADRHTLIRRVTYDLTGLPPTLQEVEAFVRDRSPNAYAKLVDRLLTSPHYGERWARHWLDLVRFAETDGHEFDFEKPNAYQYRDYVIRALNTDLPYPLFVTEHIAGDLLPRPRLHPTEGFNESIIGTGFWWLGEGKHSPVDLREDEAERIDNQIDVLSKAFLGLTVSCARCHDHKFDPIPTKDYYALAGFLKSSRYQFAAIDAPDRFKEAIQLLERIQAQLRPLLVEQAARDCTLRIEALASELLASGQAGRPTNQPWTRYLEETAAKSPDHPFYPWIALRALSPESFARGREDLAKHLRGLAERSRAEDEVVFEDFDKRSYEGWFVTGEAFGPGPSRESISIPVSPRIEGLLGWRAADSGRLSVRLQGALRSRTFTIRKSKILYRMAGRDSQVNLIIDGFQRIRDPLYGGLTIRPGSPRPAWYLQNVSKWVGHRAYIEIVDHGSGWIAVDRILFSDRGSPVPAPYPEGARLVVRLLEDSLLTSPEVLARKYAALLRETVELWASGRLEDSPEGAARCELLDWLLRGPAAPAPASAGQPQEHTAALAALLERRKRVEAGLTEPRRVMAMADGTPEDSPVYLRGSHKNPGDLVPRRFLEAIAGPNQPPIQEGCGRLELAKRMVSPPLLPRVIVNRLWLHHFGEGIVRTPDDFGIRGEHPTHPELLDWLAVDFSYACGWSLKKLHRRMVLSSTYQMSSRPQARAEALDPQDKLLHRMRVRRLEAESIRDAILAVSGRLDRKMYGPGVLPHLTPFMEGRGRPGQSGPLDGDGRRSIYLDVRRNFLPSMFLAFDFPIPFTTIGRRSVSTVPAQALTLMNDPFVVEQAEVWAKRILAEPDLTAQERLKRIYEAAFARPPTDSELSASLTFLSSSEEQDRQSTHSLRSWADLCHVLMNAKEFIFIN